MESDKKTLITIITEATLEDQLKEDMETFGVRGYTLTEARGKGHRGIRDASWKNSGNIRLEIITNMDAAKNFANHCRDAYYDDYAMIIFFQEVAVMRPDKF